MSYGGPPFSVSYDGSERDEIFESNFEEEDEEEDETRLRLGSRLPSRVVPCKVSVLGRVAVDANSQARVLNWSWGDGIKGAILQPPASWPESEMSVDSGVIRDVTREQLEDADRSSVDELERLDSTHAVGVHFAMCSTFLVWDCDSPEGPLLSPAELEVRDGRLDKDICQGRKGALQLWRGDTFLTSVSCYGGGTTRRVSEIRSKKTGPRRAREDLEIDL